MASGNLNPFALAYQQQWGTATGMKVSIMFTASGTLDRCRVLGLRLEGLLSFTVAKDYGATLSLLLVNVVVQDAGIMTLGTKLSRRSRAIRVDVPLSRLWVKQAHDPEVRRAILECVIKAVQITRQRLTRKDDDFRADELIADLKAMARRLEGQ